MADIIDVKTLDFIIDEEENIDFTIEEQEQNIDFEVERYINIATSNYNDLTNKPQINSVELIGNKSFEDLGDHNLTNLEIKAIFDRVFNN